MIVDVHSHIWDIKKHVTQEFIDDFFRNSDGDSLDAYPEQHWETIGKKADKTIVFGLKGEVSGIYVPDEYIASYVSQHSDKLIGFMSIDPFREGRAHIERSFKELGLRGIKTSPVYTNCSMLDSRFLEVFSTAEEFRLPVLLHMGPTFPHRTLTKFGDPYELEEIALRYPNLVMIVAHMGEAREKEFMHVIRKYPNLYADIADTVQKPWQCYNTLMLYHEQRKLNKLILGSDFPWATTEETISGLLKINDMLEGTKLPRIPEDELRAIVQRNSLELLGLE